MGDRSRIFDFTKFLSQIRGDLANITAPPFFLAPSSVTECGTCWTERPSIFIAPALEPSAERRALLVLRWILIALRAQFYVGCGGDLNKSIKKPLNAVLGELFFGEWKDESGSVKLTSEQISHHPPMTAVYMRSDDHGIRGEGYTRVEMTFRGSISIVQTGHAVLHIDKYNEDHLIFLPNAEVKGFLSNTLYPELQGKYHIISSAGYITELDFLAPGFLTFRNRPKNSFEAKIYSRDDIEKKALFTSSGQWSNKFAFFDVCGEKIFDWDHEDPLSQPADLILPALSSMDDWETRKLWRPTLSAIRDGRTMDVIREKSRVEEAQRQMRRVEQADGRAWKPLFFSKVDVGDYLQNLWEPLTCHVDWNLGASKTGGVWKYDAERAVGASSPYHGDLSPA